MDMATKKIELAALEAPPAVAVISRIADGFKVFQTLRAGYGSGLFDWLEHNGPAEKSAMATALGLRGAHLGGFLQALEDLGLLARQGNNYALVPQMRAALISDSPWCQAAAVDGLLDPVCGWSNLRGFLDETWQAAPGLADPAVTLHPFLGEARRLAAVLAARWRQGGDAPRQLLCFDSGDGLVSAALCQGIPELNASVVVTPAAVGRTVALLDACGLSRRCLVHAGTPLDFPLRATYDRVVLFHALYPVRKSMGDALAAVAARLTPGGELCSAHWFCLEACETAPGGLRDLDKAVLTDSHPLCHVESFGERFIAAGLNYEGREEIDGPYAHLKLHFAYRGQERVSRSACARDCGC